jgi:hypothetical protein
MPRSLADGHTKFVILTVEPVNPASPTLTELDAGIDASDRILASDFTFGAGDSDKVAEKSLAAMNNANALGASNYTAGFTVFRYFDPTTKNADADEDEVWAAVKVKGTELWCYARRNGKASTAAFAAADELFLGAYLVTDQAQPPGDMGGYIKWRVPCEVQSAYPNILVAGA